MQRTIKWNKRGRRMVTMDLTGRSPNISIGNQALRISEF
jgi:hypothetical protein